MAHFRKVDVRIWNDEKFRELSPIPPCGQGLWFFLLTNPLTTSVPGCYSIGEAAAAEALRWSLKAFREAFREASLKGMVKADWKARFVWIPRAIIYNKPESPNVVRGWRIPWDELPECELKVLAWQGLKAFLEGLGEAFVKAFGEACPHPSPQPLANQEQEQEQENIPPIDPQGTVRADIPSTLEEKNFEMGRKLWPGQKRGFRTEFENFRKKNRDWRELLDDEGFRDCIQTMIDRKAYSPGFWPMFSKCVNQKLYEMALQPAEARK